MGLMIVVGAQSSAVLLGLLVVSLGLAVWEIRGLNLPRMLTMWWLLLVLLTHVLGYLALRLWAANRQRTASQ